MSRPIPTHDYVAHFDPALERHRVWLQAALERLVDHEPEALVEGGPLWRLWSTVPAEAASAPMADSPAAVALALPLVQEFEGCELRAYPDPETGGEPWTIGWGSTRYADGRPVQPGDRIEQEEADALLATRLEHDEQLLAQRIPDWSNLSSHQRAALLSFTYNCGPNWYGSEGFATLSRCLREGALEQVPAALQLYVNPGGPSEAGLRRSRKGEAALWNGGSSRPQAEAPTAASNRPYPNPLVGVPYFQQRDCGQRSQRDRTCFSSSCAMLLEALKPGTLHQGANGDDQHLAGPPGPSGAAHRLRALADRRRPYPHPSGGERPVGGAGPAERRHPQRQRHGAPLLPAERPLRGPAATASVGWWSRSAAVPTAMPRARAGRWWWIERPEDAASHCSFSTGSRR